MSGCRHHEKPGPASGTYTKDVSPYVIGWILGIEWDPYLVKGTDENTDDPRGYEDFVENMGREEIDGKKSFFPV